MHRSLIKSPPGSRDRTPFLYAIVVMMRVGENNAASSYWVSKLVHAAVGVERNRREAEGVKKVEQGVIYRRVWVVGGSGTG